MPKEKRAEARKASKSKKVAAPEAAKA